MSVAEEAIIKSIGSVNAPLEFWGFTNSLRYHTYRLHTPTGIDPTIWTQTLQNMQSGKFNGGNPSAQTAGLVSSFQSKEKTL